MSSDLYFAQDAIRDFASALTAGGSVEPLMRQANDHIAAADVEFPGFGLIGIPIALAYDTIREYATTYVGAGADQVIAWQERLEVIADSLEAMEAANTVPPP